jgi:hypothetical protein
MIISEDREQQVVAEVATQTPPASCRTSGDFRYLKLLSNL